MQKICHILSDCYYFKYTYKVGLICIFYINFLSAQTLRVHSGNIAFLSDAPLERIEAATNKIQGIMNLTDQKLAFKLEVASFQGFNSPLQREHFNENYMQSQQYPDAHFSGKIIEDVDWSKEGTFPVRVKGKLTIKGISVEKIIKGSVQIEKDTVRIVSRFDVPLTDYDIKIPKVVFQKISEEIEVKLDITMKKKA